MDQNYFEPFCRTPQFLLYKTTEKSKFLEFFLPLIDPMVAACNETRIPTSRKKEFLTSLFF